MEREKLEKRHSFQKDMMFEDFAANCNKVLAEKYEMLQEISISVPTVEEYSKYMANTLTEHISTIFDDVIGIDKYLRVFVYAAIQNISGKYSVSLRYVPDDGEYNEIVVFHINESTIKPGHPISVTVEKTDASMNSIEDIFTAARYEVTTSSIVDLWRKLPKNLKGILVNAVCPKCGNRFWMRIAECCDDNYSDSYYRMHCGSCGFLGPKKDYLKYVTKDWPSDFERSYSKEQKHEHFLQESNECLKTIKGEFDKLIKMKNSSEYEYYPEDIQKIKMSVMAEVNRI